MSDHSKAAVQRILPGLQYLARAAHDSGAGPVSGWIAETIARIVDWSARDEGREGSATAVRAALAQVLAEARRAGLEETAGRLEESLAALERERRRLKG